MADEVTYAFERNSADAVQICLNTIKGGSLWTFAFIGAEMIGVYIIPGRAWPSAWIYFPSRRPASASCERGKAWVPDTGAVSEE